MSIPPAWHPDPTGKHDHRWWDGTRWTEHVADRGVASVDPIEAPGEQTGGPGADAGGPGATPATQAGDPGATAGGEAGGPGATPGAEAGGGVPPDGPRPGDTPQSASPDPGPGTAGTGDADTTPGAPGAGRVGPEDRTGASASPASGDWQQPDAGAYRPGPQTGVDQPGGAQPGWGGPPEAGTTGAAWAAGGGQPPAGGGGQPGAWDQPSGGWDAGGPGGAAQTPMDGMAVAAGVIGIVSLAMSVLVFGAVGGIVAIVLGGIALSRVRKNGRRGKGWAITGLVTGILSIVVAVLLIFVGYAMFQGMGGFEPFQDYAECLEETGDEEFCEQQLDEEMQRRIFGGD